MITTYKTRSEGDVSSSVRPWSVSGALAVTGLLLLLASGILRAQSVTAVLVGTVTDQSGASVPGAACDGDHDRHQCQANGAEQR